MKGSGVAKPSRSDASTGGDAEERSALDAGAAGARGKASRRPGRLWKIATWRSQRYLGVCVQRRPSHVSLTMAVFVLSGRSFRMNP